MKTAVYPGTFDPVTLGHIDVIKRASKMFDKIVIGITTHSDKKALFSLEERKSLVEKEVKDLKNVSVETFSGLLVDFVKQKNTKIILRGLRELSDFEFEFQQAVVNRKLDSDIDTVFIMTDARYFYVSSSMVKEIALLGGNIEKFVSKGVQTALKRKLAK